MRRGVAVIVALTVLLAVLTTALPAVAARDAADRLVDRQEQQIDLLDDR